MSTKLKKGQKINLTKNAPNLKRLLVGVGWDSIKKFYSYNNMDIDVSVICIDKKGKPQHIVSYIKPKQYAGAIKYYEYNRNKQIDGDDRQIEINLEKIPKNINELSIIMNVYSPYSRGHHLGKADNYFIHVNDLDTNKEIAHYDITGNFDNETGIFIADIYRHNGKWKFWAKGKGAKVRDISEMVDLKLNS